MRIQLTIIDSIAQLTLDDPKTRNALNDAAVVELHEQLARIAEMPEITLVVLRGADSTFCSGGSVAAIGDLAKLGESASGRAELARRVRINSSIIERLLQQPQLTVALIEGAAVGAGLGLAAACDLRFATEDARFIPAFGSLALTADVGTTAMLVRHLGPGKANEWLLAGTKWDATSARAEGLISDAAPIATLEERIRQTAAALLPGEGQRVARQRALSIDFPSLSANLDQEADAFAASIAADAARTRLAQVARR